MSKVIREEDIPWHIVFKAREIWRDLAKEDYEKFGDKGSPIVGDGIYVNALQEGGHKGVKFFLILSNEISFSQSSLHYEARVSEVIDFLRDNGIEANYCLGRMD